MITVFRSLLFIFIALSQSLAHADDLNARLDGLLARQRGISIGLEVYSFSNQRVIYSHQANQALLPASNVKLLTGAAALIFLGKDYSFRTQLLADYCPVEQGTLHGNLYLKFAGDPDLDIKDLDYLFDRLKFYGIRHIDGNVIVDTSIFDSHYHGPGWDASDYKYCYAPPVSAVTLSQNCVKFLVQPMRLGGLARVMITNPLSAVQIENHVQTLNRRNCRVSLKAEGGNHYIFQGCVARGRAQGFSVPLTDPHAYVISILPKILRARDMTYHGIVSGTTTEHCTVLATHYSAPLYDAIVRMMKDSDNLIANLVFKQLGHHFFQHSASWESSGEALKQILSTKLACNLQGTTLIDGSGLSSHDKLSAHHLIELLVAMRGHQSHGQDYLDTLPISGVDGTLEHRMRDRSVYARIRAKTGTLHGVTALSGYLEDHRHEWYAFSIIINGRFRRAGQFKMLEEKICKTILDSNYR